MLAPSGTARIRAVTRVVAPVLVALTAIVGSGCAADMPEYREPALGAPHGTVMVKPLMEGRGGGLRSINDLLVFPRSAPAEDMARWKYREWRIAPGMHRVEIFAAGKFIARTIHVHEGKRILFVPEKYVDTKTQGKELVVGMYVVREEDMSDSTNRE